MEATLLGLGLQGFRSRVEGLRVKDLDSIETDWVSRLVGLQTRRTDRVRE